MVYLWIISVNLVFVKYVNTEKSIKLLQLFNSAAAVITAVPFYFFKATHFKVFKIKCI